MNKRLRIGLSEAGMLELSSVKEMFERRWSSIEQAYGHPLDCTIRERVLNAIKDFINDARIEQNAALLNDAIDWLAGVRRISLEFNKVLSNHGRLSESGRRNVTVQLNGEIKSLGPAADLSTCRNMVSKLATACGRTLITLRNEGFNEGDAWRIWITDLTGILGEARLPIGAPHSRDKKSDDSVAPFVALVIAIQKALPSEIRRHDRADPLSLGREINRARKSVRDRLSRPAPAICPAPLSRDTKLPMREPNNPRLK